MSAGTGRWPQVMVSSAAGLVLAIVLGLPSPVRGVLALWFFLTCPGMAVVGLLTIADPLARALLAVAVSLAMGMLLTLAMALTHTWSWPAATAILVGVTVLGAAAQVRR